MATTSSLVETYKTVCDQQERRIIRNEKMCRDAVRLRTIFFPVNTQKLENLKSQWLLQRMNVRTPLAIGVSDDVLDIPLLTTPTSTSSSLINWDSSSPGNHHHHDNHVTTRSNIGPLPTVARHVNPSTPISIGRTIPLASSVNNGCIHIDHDKQEQEGGGDESQSPSPSELSSVEDHSSRAPEAAMSDGVEVTMTGPLLQTTSTQLLQNGLVNELKSHSSTATAISSSSSQSISMLPSDQLVSEGRQGMDPSTEVGSNNVLPPSTMLPPPVTKHEEPSKKEDTGVDSVSEDSHDTTAGLSINEPTIIKCEHADRGSNGGIMVTSTLGEAPKGIGKELGITDNNEMELIETHEISNGIEKEKGTTVSTPLGDQEDDFWAVDVKQSSPIIRTNGQSSVKQLPQDGDNDTDVSSSMSSIIPRKEKNYTQIISALVVAINTSIRKEREIAQKVYTQSSQTDDMINRIQESPVLTSVLMKRAEYGQDLSSWDTSTLGSILLKLLSNATNTHNTPSVKDFTRDTAGGSGLWKEVWPRLLEHIRLLFQSGRQLDSLANIFSSALRMDEGKLLELLQNECGIDPTSSVHDDFTVSSGSTQSSSSVTHTDSDKDPIADSNGGGGAYKQFTKSLIQYSHNSELALSSLSEDSDIAALQSNNTDHHHKPTTIGTNDQSLRIDADTNSEFNNDLSIPLSDEPQSPTVSRPKSKPILGENIINKQMDFWDDTDSKLSVPSIQADDNQDDFEFYS